MPDDLQQLQKRIEEDLAAVRELKRLKDEQERRERPKLKLIRGGMVGGVIWSGVEWLLDPRKIAVALAAAGLTATGTTIAEDPGSPSADPPGVSIPTVRPTPVVSPSAAPATGAAVEVPTATPSPRRTSPPRQSTTPVKTVPVTKPVKTTTPEVAPTAAALPVSPATTLPVTPSSAPEVTALAQDCVGVLGVCLPSVALPRLP